MNRKLLVSLLVVSAVICLATIFAAFSRILTAKSEISVVEINNEVTGYELRYLASPSFEKKLNEDSSLQKLEISLAPYKDSKAIYPLSYVGFSGKYDYTFQFFPNKIKVSLTTATTNSLENAEFSTFIQSVVMSLVQQQKTEGLNHGSVLDNDIRTSHLRYLDSSLKNLNNQKQVIFQIIKN